MISSDFTYDAIFYDFDGTLADSVPIILKSFKLAYIDVFGECKRTDEDLLSYIGLPLFRTFEMHEPEIAEKLLNSYLRINCEMLANDEIKLFDGVYKALQEIKKLGIIQGIVTSKRRVSANITLELTGLKDFFDVEVFREDTKEHKPLATPLLTAARMADIDDMSRVLYVGDALPDILCANNAGCDFALVNWTRMPKEPIIKEKPQIYLEHLNEIVAILLTTNYNV